MDTRFDPGFLSEADFKAYPLFKFPGYECFSNESLEENQSNHTTGDGLILQAKSAQQFNLPTIIYLCKTLPCEESLVAAAFLYMASCYK